MSLVLGGCHDAFLEFALDEQLDVHGYGRALARVGLVDVSKVLSGQFVDGVWARTSGADGVGLVPFCVGVGRLLRPVAWRMEDITGWPGLAAVGHKICIPQADPTHYAQMVGRSRRAGAPSPPSPPSPLVGWAGRRARCCCCAGGDPRRC